MKSIFIESTDNLRTWLYKHHNEASSVWLVKWKKETGKPYVTYDEIVDQLLCFGWIDSLPKKLDSERTMLRISPRNPKSNWSGKNKERIHRLAKQGLIEPAGSRMIAIAKANGTWTFLDDVEQLVIPEDLSDAFNIHPQSRCFFDRFPNSSKRGILEWIKSAKTATTRQKRIDDTAAKAAKNIKANHPKGRDTGPASKKK